MFKNCRKLFLLVFRNTQLGCQYLPIFDCDKDLSDDLQCNLLRKITVTRQKCTGTIRLSSFSAAIFGVSRHFSEI